MPLPSVITPTTPANTVLNNPLYINNIIHFHIPNLTVFLPHTVPWTWLLFLHKI